MLINDKDEFESTSDLTDVTQRGSVQKVKVTLQRPDLTNYLAHSAGRRGLLITISIGAVGAVAESARI